MYLLKPLKKSTENRHGMTIKFLRRIGDKNNSRMTFLIKHFEQILIALKKILCHFNVRGLILDSTCHQM